MAKEQKQQLINCFDCIHKNACQMWPGGRAIANASAIVCVNHETEKENDYGLQAQRKRQLQKRW